MKSTKFAIRRLLDDMELRQLRAFVKIAETCNFSLAAKELYTTQSALSQSLKKLEDELGAALFHRDNHNVGLTEAGDALLPYAKRTIEDADKDDAFVQGMQQVYKQLMTELEAIGVTPIEAIGQEFNPDFHNAVMQVESEEYESGIIAQEFMKGYMYKDTVVRHSMVTVVQ